MDAAIAPNTDLAPIFVIGCGRSGTTLLRQILCAHPRIHLTHEAFFYAYERHTPQELSARQWLERYFDSFSFRWTGVSVEALRDAVPPDLPRSEVRQAFRAIMKLSAARHGKVRFGEKSPLDTANLGRIFADFPDARVVYIFRDPRAIVVSYTRVPWGSSSLLLASLACRHQFTQVKPFLDRIHTLTLEELVRAPRAAIGKVLDFVGEPWDDAVLDHVRHAPTDDVPPFPWFTQATGLPLRPPSASPPSWTSALTPAWIRIIETINAESMDFFGFPRADLEPEPSATACRLALLRGMPAALASMGRHIRSMSQVWNFRRSDRHRIDPQRAMEAHLKSNPAAWKQLPEFTMPQVPGR